MGGEKSLRGTVLPPPSGLSRRQRHHSLWAQWIVVIAMASRNYPTSGAWAWASTSAPPAPGPVIAGDTILSAPGGVTAQSCCPTCILRTTSESWAHLHLEEQSPEAQPCLQLKEHSTEPQPQTTPTEGKEISWSTGSTQTNWRKR